MRVCYSVTGAFSLPFQIRNYPIIFFLFCDLLQITTRKHVLKLKKIAESELGVPV